MSLEGVKNDSTLRRGGLKNQLPGHPGSRCRVGAAAGTTLGDTGPEAVFVPQQDLPWPERRPGRVIVEQASKTWRSSAVAAVSAYPMGSPAGSRPVHTQASRKEAGMACAVTEFGPTGLF